MNKSIDDKKQTLKDAQAGAYLGKVHMNVTTVGHADHGKTSTTAALSKICSELYPKFCSKIKTYEEIDNAKEERERGITINASHIEYITEKRHYAHVDCPGHSDYLKNMITGTSVIHTAVLVVAGPEGCMPQTAEHLIILKNNGVKNMVVFYNKMDMVESEGFLEIFETLVKPEMEQQLAKIGFTNVPFIEGSAVMALKGDTSKYGLPAFKKLIDAIDAFDDPILDSDSPFYMQAQQLLDIPGRGRTLTGVPKRGMIKINDNLELVTPDHRVNVRAIEIQTHHKNINVAKTGDDVSILLKDAPGGEVELKTIFENKKTMGKTKSFVLAKPNTVYRYEEFLAQVHIYSKESSALKKALQVDMCPTMFLGSSNVTGRIIGIYNLSQFDELQAFDVSKLSNPEFKDKKPKGEDMVGHDSQAILHITFDIKDKNSKFRPPKKHIIEKDQPVLLMESKGVVGGGKVILPVGKGV